MGSVVGTRNTAPRYVEAYPRFDVVRADAVGTWEKTLCLFFSEKRHPRGVLFVGQHSKSSIRLEFSVSSPYLDYAFGHTTLPM